MAKVYRCPNGCSVSDTYKRCKVCGAWLKYDGDHSIEEVNKKSEELTMSHIPAGVKLPNK